MRISRSTPAVLAGALALLALSAAPALAAAPETPVTLQATAVTGNSAVLHGELNPGKAGEAGQEYQFLYALSVDRCRIPQETEYLPEPPAVSLGDKEEAVEIEATNLRPGTTYSFCLLEEHEGEEIQSSAVTFKTLPAAKPFVYKETTLATEVGAFSATLNAAVNPEEQETTYSFEYATNEAFTGAKTISGTSSLQPPASFYEEVPASLATGNVFAAETTYYFRVLATNSTGTTVGPVEHFTTQPPAEPVVRSENITDLNSLEPQLDASINPNYEETSYSFEYSTEATEEVLEGAIHTLPGAPPAKLLPAVFDEEPGALAGPVGISGLQGGVVYYYRVVANDKTSEEAHKPVYGPMQSFQADGTPLTSLNAAGEPTRTTAGVSGSITPQGLASAYHFVYVPIADYRPGAGECPAGIACAFAAGANTYEAKLTGEHEQSLEDYAAHPVAATLEELAPGTTYVYALVARNELGTTVGAPATFTTAPPIPPLAATGGASGVTQSSATLTGSVDTRGLQTKVQFEFGTVPDAGESLPATVVPGSENGTTETVASALAGALQPATTYYYRLIATSRDGAGEGAEQSFTTPGFPAVFPAAVVPAAVPYTSIAALDAKEVKEGGALVPVTGSLTRKQKLSMALKVCHKQKGARRAMCEMGARRRYGAAKKGKRRRR